MPERKRFFLIDVFPKWIRLGLDGMDGAVVVNKTYVLWVSGSLETKRIDGHSFVMRMIKG